MCIIFIRILTRYLKYDYIVINFIVGLTIALIFGMSVCKYRTSHLIVSSINQPVISKISGTIESITPNIKGVVLIIKQAHIEKLNITLQKTRITISQKYINDISVNDKISLLAKVYPIQGSIIPLGYDFGFYSYFNSIGASGYGMSNIKIIAKARHKTYKSVIHNIRSSIYNKLIYDMGSEQGNVMAAILLGTTKGLNKIIISDMRKSGISHILCVSGLHLSLVAMIAFITLRFLLNISDWIAFNCNIKIVSAIGSLIMSYYYLELTGMHIAATRAYITIAIFMIAIIIERNAYPMRSIALAAFVILSLNPEYIFHPSFQLSFMAVLSLISGYELYLKNQWILGTKGKGIISSIRFYITSNIYSSFLASIVTAPVVINQFFVFSTYSIPMNLIIVPIVSILLMPMSIIALMLMPFNLHLYIIKWIGVLISIIIRLSEFTSSLDSSILYFGYITSTSLIIFLIGFFWVCLWQTTWRIFGLMIILISFVLMTYSPKPDIIIDVNLKAVGVKNENKILEVYTDYMPNFSKKYWAHWFGQVDLEIYKAQKEYFITTASGKTVGVNFDQNKCFRADVQVNIAANCIANELTIDTNLLKKYKIISIFCNKQYCKIKYDDNSRFTIH